MPLVWNEGIPGNQYNLGKFEESQYIQMAFNGGDCNVNQRIGQSEAVISLSILSWMFSTSFHINVTIMKIIYHNNKVLH